MILFYTIFKSCKNTRIIFQNEDDKKFIKQSSNFLDYKSYIIPGSGINLQKFSYKKIIKKNHVNFLFASRLLIDKGLQEFITASQLILDNKYDATFTIIGEIDNLNPSCIDIILTDQPNLVLNSGVRPSLDPLVKHQMTFCKLNFKIPDRL